MKPAPFAYHAPGTLNEALGLLADGDRDVRVLAGGQSLVPMMNFRLAAPDVLVDISRLAELRYLRLDGDDCLHVGAATRQCELLRDDRVSAGWPLLGEGVRHIGHPQIRSRGTVGGSIAHHDPAAELPALAVAMDATLTVASAAGRRQAAAADFFVSSYEVALEPGEMLVDAGFPAIGPGTGWSFQELARRSGDFALVGAACLLRPGPGARIGAARLVLFGVGQRPLRVTAAEEALTGSTAGPAVVTAVARIVASSVHPVDDLHATAGYRRAAAAELASRCVLEAWERADHD